MTEWFWGLDISTKAVSLAVLSDDNELRWVTGERPRRPGLRAFVSGWPDYLIELRHLITHMAELHGRFYPPTVIGLEQPLGRHPSPRLMAAWGICIYATRLALPDTMLLDLRPQDWRADVGLKRNTSKAEILAWAIGELGYKGDDENEADACAIAAATRARYRNLAVAA